tara:strand:- start:335 stop:532 length:198 start_codon:yes stop_codon:yes gene_type:complete
LEREEREARAAARALGDFEKEKRANLQKVGNEAPFLRFQLFEDSSYDALSHVALEEEARSFNHRI